MPDLLIFMVGLFALIPFLGGLTLMAMMAARAAEAEKRENSNTPPVPISRVNRDSL
jgi:hypothetical protein